MKYVFGILMLLASATAVAGIDKDDLGDFNKLTDQQKAQVVSQIANMKAQNGGDIPTTPEKLKEWTEVGTAIGKGMAATAKELGIALDEFSKSTVGKIALVLLVWHVAGDDIFGIFFGTLWLIVGISIWTYFFKRIVMKKKIEFVDNGDKKPTKVVTFDTDEATEAQWILSVIALIIIVAAGFITIFAG